MKRYLLPFSLMFCAFFFLSNSSSAAVDWVGNMFPASGSTSSTVEGNPVTIYVQVYKAGTTEPAGQGPGMMCQIYYGEVVNFGDSWMNISSVNMAYNVDIGNNDEYQGNLAPPAGNYEFTCRCSDDFGATWTYASLPAGNGQLIVDAAAPVDLTYFNAQQKSNGIVLKWETANEYFSSHFEVERSGDGRQWEMLSRQESQSFAGGKYEWVDRQVQTGKNYYRLAMVDLDKSKTYSEVLMIQKGESGRLKAFPNPVRDQLNFRVENRELIQRIEIYNSQGQVLLSKNFEGENNFSIGVEGLRPGVYFYRVLDRNNQFIAQDLFVKN